MASHAKEPRDELEDVRIAIYNHRHLNINSVDMVNIKRKMVEDHAKPTVDNMHRKINEIDFANKTDIADLDKKISEIRKQCSGFPCSYRKQIQNDLAETDGLLKAVSSENFERMRGLRSQLPAREKRK